MTSNSAEEWRKSTLKRGRLRDDVLFETTSHIPQEVAYTTEDLTAAGWDERERLGFPGEYPYTRGVQPTMYRGRLWTMRQYAGYASAEESNARYRYLLDRGQTGLSVAFDLPTQMGYDPDHPMAEGEVGKVGVSIASIEDMQELFASIPLDKVTTSMTINSTAAILLALYIAVAKQQGVDPRVLNGTVQNDILKEYIARGTYIYPPRPSLRLITDLFAYCAEAVPRWNTISISGYHMREAGATAVQELAFTLANGIEYVNAALRVGQTIDDFAPRLAFFFDAHNNLLEEVAKFRAARRMWAKIMRERFGAQDPRSLMLRFHTQTAGVTLQAQQIDNNVVRVTVQALAAVLGGTQSLHTNAKDEALALPTSENAQLALRTQQVLAFESGVADVVDPLAGSYYVEALTDEIERRAWEYIERIDQRGGALQAVESGYIQAEITEAAYEYQCQVERGQRVIVGTNRFQSTEAEPTPDILTVDPSVRQRQCQRLRALRSRRDKARCQNVLERLQAAAANERENLLPLIVQAVEAYCTLGEISDAFRAVWGEARDFGRI
ncbi:MAG: methylmalonyl-CoA mutase family protein [Chloroflexi bacterium]|nr:methylmalonyl-CoA mutase family protein [Chloroflexota bacterium]